MIARPEKRHSGGAGLSLFEPATRDKTDRPSDDDLRAAAAMEADEDAEPKPRGRPLWNPNLTLRHPIQKLTGAARRARQAELFAKLACVRENGGRCQTCGESFVEPSEDQAVQERRKGCATHRMVQRAAGEIVASVEAFVHTLVRPIAYRMKLGEADLEDVIAEGRDGALHAVFEFEPERGFSFLTYAAWWIRHRITRWRQNQSRTVRVPVHLLDTFSKFMRAMDQAKGDEARMAEVRRAYEFDLGTWKSANLLSRLRGGNLSFDAPVMQESTTTLADVIADEAPTAEERLVEGGDVEMLRQAMAALPERERTIIEGRLAGKTLEEIATDMKTEHGGVRIGITRERVRQIEAHAFSRIRRQLGRIKLGLPVEAAPVEKSPERAEVVRRVLGRRARSEALSDGRSGELIESA